MNDPANYLAASGEELLAAVPEELWDSAHPDLLGESVRDAARHVDESGCLLCRSVLRELGEAS